MSVEVTPAAAQPAIAREYELSSRPALKAEVQQRNRSLEEAVEVFLAASVGHRVGRAARLPAERPEIAEHSVATALGLAQN